MRWRSCKTIGWKIRKIDQEYVEVNLQATLPKSCRANDCICCLGKGANSFSFRKSYTHIPRSSETKHIWLRWSNQCDRCIHLLEKMNKEWKNGVMQRAYCRFMGSRSLSFCKTRTSILLASRYFGMARIILIATLVLFWVSTASTTFPNVPCPKSRTVRSMGSRQSLHWPILRL